QLKSAGEIGRAGEDEGKYLRCLGVARGQKRQPLGAPHDREPVADDVAEAPEQPLAFRHVAAQQRDLLGILPHANQVEAKVRFELLLAEVERNEWPADQVRERGAEYRIEQGPPYQIAGDDPLRAEQWQ